MLISPKWKWAYYKALVWTVVAILTFVSFVIAYWLYTFSIIGWVYPLIWMLMFISAASLVNRESAPKHPTEQEIKELREP